MTSHCKIICVKELNDICRMREGWISVKSSKFLEGCRARNKIAIPEILLNPRGFSSVRLSTQEPEYRSRYSDWLRAGRPAVRVRVLVGSRIFPSPRRPNRLWGPPSLLSNCYRGAFFRGVKRSGREADHSPPTSAKVKNMWMYTSTPPYAFIA
jgi:hypothetical protein